MVINDVWTTSCVQLKLWCGKCSLQLLNTDFPLYLHKMAYLGVPTPSDFFLIVACAYICRPVSRELVPTMVKKLLSLNNFHKMLTKKWALSTNFSVFWNEIKQSISSVIPLDTESLAVVVGQLIPDFDTHNNIMIQESICLSPAHTTKFTLTSFPLTCLICSYAWQKLTSCLFQKLARPAFEQGSLSRKIRSCVLGFTVCSFLTVPLASSELFWTRFSSVYRKIFWHWIKLKMEWYCVKDTWFFVLLKNLETWPRFIYNMHFGLNSIWLTEKWGVQVIKSWHVELLTYHINNSNVTKLKMPQKNSTVEQV